MNTLTKYFPWLVVAAFVLYAVGKAYPRAEKNGDLNMSPFGALPCLDDGRIKPIDSVARTSLLFVSGRSDWDDKNDDKQPAIRWLLDVMSAEDPHTGPAADHKVFRIDNEQVLIYLGLPERPGSYRYSFNEIRKAWPKFMEAFGKAQQMDDKKQDLFHAKILELGRRLKVYQDLAQRRTPAVVPKEKGSDTWLSLAEVDDQIVAGYEPLARKMAAKAAEERVDKVLREMGKDPARLTPQDQAERAAMVQELVPRFVPDLLRTVADKERPEVSPAAAVFVDILKAYRENRPKGFAEAIEKYKAEYVYPINPTFRDNTKLEQAYNAAAPFYLAAILYVFAGVLVAVSWLGWDAPLRKAAIGLALVALGLNVVGLAGRMYLMGRPLVFVTNLYSSALLIGCGAVIGCLLIEWAFRNGIGLVVGTTIGAATVKIAHHLSTDGKDTMGSLVAVLDTNFWLASHVTTVTLGYAATFVAGLLGLVYIVWGAFLTTLDREKQAAVGKMIYGTLCFATLLSFVGTVLGGIWADQSWGRFWGWDPKENGAVLIVIWNALILHARWGGMVKQRGMAVLAVVGIMVTTWSWFGTNQLGVGLHNYGFNKELADGCMYTWLGSMVVVATGLIPLRFWRSYPVMTRILPASKPAR